jgi:hypothetical protein
MKKKAKNLKKGKFDVLTPLNLSKIKGGEGTQNGTGKMVIPPPPPPPKTPV